MSEIFNYEEVFMGVTEGKPRSYRRSFKEDYRLKRLKEALPTISGKILDIGCGGGVLTESLRYHYPKAKLYGCDVSKIAISYAKKYGSGKVTYGVIKDKKLPYPNNYIDVCVCFDVMEHIPNVPFFLKEVQRILKANGKFFLLVPCEGQPATFTWLFQKIKFGKNLTYKSWGHIHPEFTHSSVEKLLNKHGFKIVKRTYSEHLFYQLTNLILYFWPREILEKVLGDRAHNYYDAAVVRKKAKGDLVDDPIMFLRKIWLSFTRSINVLRNIETETMKNIPATGWKIQLLSVKINQKASKGK